MMNVSKMAGAWMLAALLAACGGGGGSGDGDGSVVGGGAASAADPVNGATDDAVAAPAAPAVLASTGAESIGTEVAESVATDPWTPTWDDAELDAYYPNRPINVSVTGQGSVGNSVRGTAGPMNCVQGGSLCSVSYMKYKTVVLTAVPKTGQVFRGWGGACIDSGTRETCEIRNYMLHNVVATFGPA